MDELRTIKLSADAALPTRAHADDAGLDLYSLETVELAAGQGAAVATGIAVAVGAGHVGLVADRSSLAKRGLKTSGGIIDAGYRGEIKVLLWNLSGQTQRLARGERIAQLLIVPIATPRVHQVESLEETARGSRGFGSTGQ
jgi:dUTP pyrophosphatase